MNKALELILNYKFFKASDFDKEEPDDTTIKECLPNSCKKIIKREEALDIIIEKNVDVGRLKASKSVEEYNSFAPYYKLSQLLYEEFYLLKEVLNKKKTIKYYSIFEKVSDKLGKLICIVENKNVAIEVCKNNSGFYYVENEVLRNE